jgi:predicted nucleic acid-binding protein
VQFADTNVLLYSVSGAPHEHKKRVRADELLSSSSLGLSVQVLQEFYVQATRETRADRLTHEQAAGLVESFRRFCVQETTVAVVLAAMSSAPRFHISYWDAAILEAARALRCEVVLSEDLNPGQDYEGIRVENPFSDC